MVADLDWMEDKDLLGEERDRRSSVFEITFLPMRGHFTTKQWQAVCLFWRDSLTQGEIALRLSIDAKAVSGRLRRAWKRKETEERRIREGWYDFRRRFGER